MDYCLLIPSQSRVLCRGEQLLLTFFDRGSCQLKLIRVGFKGQGAESAGRLFSTWCSSTCRSTRKLRDLKSPAPIPDPGLILNAFPLQIFLRGYFAFQVNPFTGWNSASASVTQPYFFFIASKTLSAVPLFMSRKTAFPSSIAWRFEPSASIMVIAGFSLRFRYRAVALSTPR